MIVCPFKDLGRYAAIIPGLEEAVEAAAKITDWSAGNVALSGGNKILVQELDTKSPEGKLCEAHKDYLDIQYIVEGEEVVGWAPIDTVTETEPFNEEKDAGKYEGEHTPIQIKQGYCYVVFPEDAHAPGLYTDEPGELTKVVVKLKL